MLSWGIQRHKQAHSGQGPCSRKHGVFRGPHRFLVLLGGEVGEGISTEGQDWTGPTSWRDSYAVQRDQRGNCQEGKTWSNSHFGRMVREVGMGGGGGEQSRDSRKQRTAVLANDEAADPGQGTDPRGSTGPGDCC